MIVSAYSDRIYKSRATDNLQNMIVDCNDVKIEIYSRIMRGVLDIKDVNTTYIIDNYHVNTYYANMIIRNVKAIIEDQVALQKLNIETLTSKIEAQNSKIDSLNKKLAFWRNMKSEIIAYINDGKDKTVFPYSFKNGKMTHSKYGEWATYEFELYVDKRIREIKSNIYNAKNRLNRLNQKLKNTKAKPSVVCFGSRDFFKKQFTVDKYINNHELWKTELQNKRHHTFTISGCANHIDGSMCMRYNNETKVLSIMSHEQGAIPDGGKYARQTYFEIPCVFKYREAEYLEAITNQETMAYEILDFGKYFVIKAVFEYYDKAPLISDATKGVNAIDINVDRFALTEIDKHGNLVNRKVVYFDLDNLSSEQVTKTLEKAAIEVSEFCKLSGKPLVREDITSIKFKDTGDKKRNKTLTQFAYDKMIEVIDRRLTKDGFMVHKVNPKFTSQQGKIKYMAAMGLSIHESAAFCIGRRFMFKRRNNKNKPILYYEDLGQYKRFGNISSVSKHFKKLSINNIYKLNNIQIDLSEYKSLAKYIKAVNDYIYG